MKRPILLLLLMLTIFEYSCHKSENKNNNGKSHAILTTIYVDSFAGGGAVAGYKTHFNSDAKGAETYRWDFGDGKTSVDTFPDHVYQKEGSYSVKLKVDDDDFVTATVSVNVVKVPTVTATLAGMRTWRYTPSADVNGIIYTDSTQVVDMEIKYIDPVTISFGGAEMNFLSAVTSGAITVIKFGKEWDMYNDSRYLRNYFLAITRSATQDSFYYSETRAERGVYYFSKYTSP